jgi:acyl carrier protein
MIFEPSVLDFVVSSVRQLFNNDSITAQDNFFERGGDSMAAIDFVALIQQKYKIKLDLVTLFEQRKLENLAQVIATQLSHGQ